MKYSAHYKMRLIFLHSLLQGFITMNPRRIGKTRDILVKFESHSKRNILYKNRKVLPQTTTPVFVNEDLTQRRSQLFYEARRLKKQGRVFGAWSQHGNILIKVKQQSQPKAVVDYNDIMIPIVCQSWLSADLGFGSVRVCVSVVCLDRNRTL